MSKLVYLLAAAALAGCASGPPAVPGKYLVYRDGNGAVIRQFDYAGEDFCARVEKSAGSSARCQPDSVGGQMPAHATLRYNPPGVLVEAHYNDMARCESETGKLGPGVQLINGCKTR
ncbi:MAG: hypothetical protein V4864_24440 [Pseudomonadota bacterium]